jgi:hypothetical protein
MKRPTQLFVLPSALVAAALFTSCADTLSTSQATGYRTGQEVRDLPTGALTETVGGTRYYNFNGTYYRPDKERYVVVDAPTGKRSQSEAAYVDRLPPGYHMKRYAGEDYFLVNKTYYKQRGAGFVVVDRPF